MASPTTFRRRMFSAQACDICAGYIAAGKDATFVKTETQLTRTCGKAACLTSLGVRVPG